MQGYNSDEGMLFGKENKALPYSANAFEINGIEQAESFISDTGTDILEFSSRVGICTLRKDDKIQCWSDIAKGVISYTP